MAEKEGKKNSDGTIKIGFSYGFGSALAITISWSLHKSILWAMLHGGLSWFYVIYYALTRNGHS